MPLRVTLREAADADEIVETLLLAGFEAGTSREGSVAGDDEEVYVVHTDAPAGEVEEMIDEMDAWLEVTDPMSGTAAPVQPDPPPAWPASGVARLRRCG